MSELLKADLVSGGSRPLPDFEKNPRRQQEIRCRPFADKVYRAAFGEDIVIARCEKGDDKDKRYLLDREFAVDVEIRLPIGMIITGQEKFLSNNYAAFRSVTVEYMQNPLVDERGDWFRLASQFYFVGYLNKKMTDFTIWTLLNWPSVVLATHNHMIQWRDQGNTKTNARASFRYCKMDDIPDFCVIANKLQEPL